MSEHDIEALVGRALRRAGFEDLAGEARRLLVEYASEVDHWSERVHLVGKGRLGKNIELLVLDSLLLLRIAEERGVARGKIADVGSGAGFPGVIWKIARPGLDLTLFERRLKPQLFLERIVARLRLAGVEVVGGEAERYAGAETFDLVVSKAAGKLDVILPLAERLLVPGGVYITVKGRGWKGEAEEPRTGSMRFETAAALPEKRGTTVIFRKTRSI